MATVEEIQARLSVGVSEEVLALLQESCSSCAATAAEVTIHCCRHAKLETDICVFVIRQERVPAGGSSEGIRIAAGLRHIGSVRHVVWHAVENPNNLSERRES